MPFEEAWQIVSDFISNPKQVWAKGDYAQMELVRHLCFSEPISIDRNKKCRTIKKSPVFATFEGNSRDFSSLAHRLKSDWNLFYDNVIDIALFIKYSGLVLKAD